MTDFSKRRTMMVDTQVRPSDVTKFPIIDAMLNVAREDFVPTAQREAAYVGENLNLGQGRVLLEPRSLAKMLDVLAIDADELVLDVGCTLGYSTAVIARGHTGSVGRKGSSPPTARPGRSVRRARASTGLRGPRRSAGQRRSEAFAATFKCVCMGPPVR